MKIIKELEEQYFEIDNQYSTEEFKAHTSSDNKKEDFWKRKRELNTHAYFLFAFTRLEDHITTNSINLILDKRINISHWKTRAIWDNTDEDNMNLKKRVGLLTEKGQADYNKIIEYYKLRNRIAHGETVSDITQAINMIDVFDDMKKYFKKIKK